jgi:hypothetical protein
MKQELLNELNAIDSDIVFINCTNMGNVPHISRGPRFNVPLLKRQVASLITMGYKIEILSFKKEVLVEEDKVVEISQEIKLDVPEETRVVIVETIPKLLEELVVQLEKKENEVVEETSIDNGLDGMSKTKLKKLLKEHNVEFENSDSIEVLKEKASAII